MNCDRIARVYRWIEYLAFGSELERRRFRYLPDVAGARRVLILGDGDGRFLKRFRDASAASVDYVDCSARMLELARARAGNDRIRFCHADALAVPLPASSYDLIVTHFLLDCFDAQNLESLINRVSAAAQPGALWLISEFRRPLWARPLLAMMYLFFRLAAGLKNQHLIDHRPFLTRHGFTLQCEETSRAGFIASELWRLSK